MLPHFIQHTHVQWVTRPIRVKEQLLPWGAGGIGDVACRPGSQLKSGLAAGSAHRLVLGLNKAVIGMPKGWTDGVENGTCKQAQK